MTDTTFTQTPEQAISEILGRYTVTDLIEQTYADLERGDAMFYKADSPIEIVDQGTAGVIRWWKVLSGDRFYEVRRFENFVWCSCKSFYFTKKMCKHLVLTAGVLCERCQEMRAKVGKLCYDCDGIVNRFRKG